MVIGRRWLTVMVTMLFFMSDEMSYRWTIVICRRGKELAESGKQERIFNKLVIRRENDRIIVFVSLSCLYLHLSLFVTCLISWHWFQLFLISFFINSKIYYVFQFISLYLTHQWNIIYNKLITKIWREKVEENLLCLIVKIINKRSNKLNEIIII